jgi:hypothetical protein
MPSFFILYAKVVRFSPSRTAQARDACGPGDGNEQWLRRKASQRLAGSGALGARFIQREIVLSETSKPSMRSSPWMRGAPQPGFSATICKINSRVSFGVGLLPTCLRCSGD